MDLLGVCLVASGACGGAVVRYGAHELGKARGHGPLSICAVNVAGSFLLGLVSAAATPRAQLALGTGFCGALTTFSTYSMDTVRMLREGQIVRAGCYVAASNVLSVASAGAGYSLGMCAMRRGSAPWAARLPLLVRTMKETNPPARPPT
ncbi:hypothetical protein AB1Y20_006304 [Prymnesium parvum]|uniref:Fluoride ion transporter CrcB n=1 Tax=Prymnesium parvum TaxID=97485 RepID=A0AB34J5J2_PRYPA